MCGVDTSGLYFGTDWEDEEGGVEAGEDESLPHLIQQSQVGCNQFPDSPYEFLRRFQSSRSEVLLTGEESMTVLHNGQPITKPLLLPPITSSSLSPSLPVDSIPGADLIVVDSCRGEETRFYCRRHLGSALDPPMYVFKNGKNIPVCEECFLDGLPDDALLGGTE